MNVKRSSRAAVLSHWVGVLTLIAISAGCGSQGSQASASPSPQATPSPSPSAITFAVDLTLTGQLAGHITVASPNTTPTCGAGTATLSATSGANPNFVTVPAFDAVWRVTLNGKLYRFEVKRAPYAGPGKTYPLGASRQYDRQPNGKPLNSYQGFFAIVPQEGRTMQNTLDSTQDIRVKPGIVSVAADEKSGTLNTDLVTEAKPGGRPVGHISGMFRCAL